MSNSIKFTQANKTVTLSFTYTDKQLDCSVQDQGIGISEEAQKHIFEAFSQAETSTTRKFGGTGLGLAISSKLVQILGGELKLESKQGEGSHFYFSIPVEEVNFKGHDTETLAINQRLYGHALLVEDNRVNQMLMSAILKKSQLTFDIANDGNEALSAFQLKKYDVILMDENMPNLNGIEATKRIRQIEQLEERIPTPIIALTANAMTGDRERFLASGMDEYVAKPINKTKLLQVMAKFLS